MEKAGKAVFVKVFNAIPALLPPPIPEIAFSQGIMYNFGVQTEPGLFLYGFYVPAGKKSPPLYRGGASKPPAFPLTPNRAPFSFPTKAAYLPSFLSLSRFAFEYVLFGSSCIALFQSARARL
jgi:hypothetical protein